MEGVNNKKRLVVLDWGALLDNKGEEEEPPQELVVVAAGTAAKRPKRDTEADKQWSDEFTTLSVQQLIEKITRSKKTLRDFGDKLPDKGEKLKCNVKRMEDEIERRKTLALEKDKNEMEDTIESCNSSVDGASSGIKRDTSKYPPHAKFGNLFLSKLKMDEKEEGSRTVNAFQDELSYINPCQQRRSKPNGKCSGRGRQMNGLPSRQKPFQCPIDLSVDAGKLAMSNDDKGGSPSSKSDVEIHVPFSKMTSQDQPSRKLEPRDGQTVVLVDEEEPHVKKTMQEVERLDDCMKDITIYYPSRDDPESVAISYTDMECLAPEGYLSSTIMNFYIRADSYIALEKTKSCNYGPGEKVLLRYYSMMISFPSGYLQQPASPSERCNYHFFNTYFYKKLKEAVLSKGNVREALFLKFRRWWKGVNIFEKAYILLPVHDNQHWSLVIICIPAKEDESGPILLHLDSLGLHSSKPIFENVKRFLKEEWKYLGNGEAPSDLPFTDKIWQNLDRRMDEKIITVPQQRNDYDCGIFVLFFMERFIEEAPVRLKKKDLSMFSKKWFDPEEASGLRKKIRLILRREFEKAREKKPILEP